MQRHVFRGLFLIPFAVIAVLHESFFTHVQYFLSGAVSGALIRNNWPLVALNIALFLTFIGFLRVRDSIEWSPAKKSSLGIYAAFIVSLFVEMYGIPLTIFLGSGLVAAPGQPPAYLFSLHFLGATLALNMWMLLGVAVTVTGMALIAAGWWQVYTADGLVTDGLYQYSRNPQYVGFILIALGWVIGWPTVLTLALFPLLVGAYYYVSQKETEDLCERFGDEYISYAENVPLLI